jgi:hypothetical protein
MVHEAQILGDVVCLEKFQAKKNPAKAGFFVKLKPITWPGLLPELLRDG